MSGRYDNVNIDNMKVLELRLLSGLSANYHSNCTQKRKPTARQRCRSCTIDVPHKGAAQVLSE